MEMNDDPLKPSSHAGDASPDQAAAGLREADETFIEETSLPKSAEVKGLNFWYGNFQALTDVNVPILENHVTALIGPSGCGKSTFLRCFNRMHDLYSGNRYAGEIRLCRDNINIISPEVSPMWVRLNVGMVFQKPNPFPKSIYENVASGLRIRGIRSRRLVDTAVQKALKESALWDEVKDRLHTPAMDLSGGQQQRLCIARALAPGPSLLLLDEPTSALDPIATARIEDLITELGKNITVLIVTHNMQQAARVSDYTAFMHLGKLIEYGETGTIFTAPKSNKTSDYITGRFG